MNNPNANEILAGKHASVMRSLLEMWGERMPTWEEFKQAKAGGRVSTDKAIALRAIHWRGVPKTWMIIYGILTPWIGFLVVPVAIAMYFFRGVSRWWILGSVCTAWFLLSVTKEGACEAIKDAATRDEEIYEALVKSGAFLFGPALSSGEDRQSTKGIKSD